MGGEGQVTGTGGKGVIEVQEAGESQRASAAQRQRGRVSHSYYT